MVGKSRNKILLNHFLVNMKNIRIVKTGIDVSKIVEQLQKHHTDWNHQTKIDNAQSLLDRGYDALPMGVLQLVVGGVRRAQDFVGDSNINIPTPAFRRHTAVIEFISKNFHNFCRCGFLSLPVGGEVGLHIDEGKYYKDKDRYHLSILGKYEYTVGDETVLVEPGTLMWFNNKLMHGARNVGDCTRVTFVFDVPHNKSNP